MVRKLLVVLCLCFCFLYGNDDIEHIYNTYAKCDAYLSDDIYDDESTLFPEKTCQEVIAERDPSYNEIGRASCRERV